MKIVNFYEFCQLPVGTIFTYCEDRKCVGLWSKGKTIYDNGERSSTEYSDIPIDYFQKSLLPIYYNDENSIGMMERWAEFDYDCQYAIYEKEDLEILTNLLHF